MPWTPEQRAASLQQEPIPQFFAQVTPKLQRMYSRSYEELADWPQRKWILPYHRRARAEGIALSVASSVGVDGRLISNESGDQHLLLVLDPVAMTLSRTRGPSRAPRPSNARRLYSGYGRAGQYPLRYVGEEVQEPVQVRADGSAIYVILAHGPDPGDRRRLGFLWANFMALGGLRYVGSGIDLLSLYGEDDEAAVAGGVGPTAPPPITLR